MRVNLYKEPQLSLKFLQDGNTVKIEDANEGWLIGAFKVNEEGKLYLALASDIVDKRYDLDVDGSIVVHVE